MPSRTEEARSAIHAKTTAPPRRRRRRCGYMGAKAGTNRAMAGQSGAQQSEPAAAAPAPQPPPPAAPVSDANDRISQLQQLAALHSSGALTDEEFAAEKAKILG